jgi:nucleoside-specific outer membrane channel protein Tsx
MRGESRPPSAIGQIMNSRIALSALSFACLNSIGAAHAQGTAEAAAPADPKPFIHWSDDSLTLLPYGWGFEVDPDEQSTFTYEHVHGSRIGDLFVFFDSLRFHDTPNGVDDSTWYGEISPRLSLGKTLGKDLSFTLSRYSLFEFKDVLVAATYERGEDADVAEAALVGVGFDLNVRESGPLGRLGQFKYLQLNVYGRSELTEGTRTGFHDVQVTVAAARPFSIGRARFLADGYFDWVVGLGSEDWNYHLNPQVSLDVGDLWGTPDKLFAGVEVDLWWNKYQIPNSPAFDTNQAAVSLMFKYHL